MEYWLGATGGTVLAPRRCRHEKQGNVIADVKTLIEKLTIVIAKFYQCAGE